MVKGCVSCQRENNEEMLPLPHIERYKGKKPKASSEMIIDQIRSDQKYY